MLGHTVLRGRVSATTFMGRLHVTEVSIWLPVPLSETNNERCHWPQRPRHRRRTQTLCSAAGVDQGPARADRGPRRALLRLIQPRMATPALALATADACAARRWPRATATSIIPSAGRRASRPHRHRSGAWASASTTSAWPISTCPGHDRAGGRRCAAAALFDCRTRALPIPSSRRTRFGAIRPARPSKLTPSAKDELDNRKLGRSTSRRCYATPAASAEYYPGLRPDSPESMDKLGVSLAHLRVRLPELL